MDFEEVKKEHILQAIKDFEEKGYPNGLSDSKYYDVKIKGQLYPPKPIMAYANMHASGKEPGNYFSGGKDTPCFKAFKKHGFDIIEKTLEGVNVDEYLREFSTVADNWFQKESWLEEWYQFYQSFFTKENLQEANWEDFQDMGNRIHSFNSMAIAKGNALGNMNLPIEEYRRIFQYIVSNDDPINTTINNLYKKYNGSAFLPYFSDSSISELIAYAFPDKYVLYNRRDLKALEILGLKLENVRGEKFGDSFLRYNEFIQPVLEKYQKIVGKRTNTTIQLELDQFFSWLYINKKADQPIKDLIRNYKKLIRSNGLENEKYKWELIRDSKGQPSLEKNLEEGLNSIKFNNILYKLAVPCIKGIARDFEKELKVEFHALFDDSIDLNMRISKFYKNTLKLYRKAKGENSHHQDERSISAYLTLQNPAEYTFYKSTYYTEYCNLINEKSAKAKEKYSHYLELIKDLAENYISNDEELLNIVHKELNELVDADPNYLLVAQDMLYQLLDAQRGESYWVFQGNPKVYDFKTALRHEILDEWTVSAHKDKIKVGDKVILWITGDDSGCYALAEITSNPQKKTNASDDHLWKEEDTSELKAGIKITHNLVDSPILKNDIKGEKELEGLNVGHQGTNFTATQKEFEKLIEMSTIKNDVEIYHISPGSGGVEWTNFFEGNYMAISYDENDVGPLDQYESQQEIAKKTGLGLNTNTARSLDLIRTIKHGSILLANNGVDDLLGIGLIVGDYEYHEGEEYLHRRKVKWLVNQPWFYEEERLLGYPETFRRDTFSKSKIGGFILAMFIQDYPEYYETLIRGGVNPIVSNHEIQDHFKYYLKLTKTKNKPHYLSALNTISAICKKEGLVKESIFELHTKNRFEGFKDKLINNQEFNDGNLKGNNMFYASLEKYTELIEKLNITYHWEKMNSVNLTSMNQILYGPPGTGKTYNTRNLALQILGEKIEGLSRKEIKKLYDTKVESGNIVFTTFHQSMSYEDFIEGIKPSTKENNVIYNVVDGLFKKLSEKATDNIEKSENPSFNFQEALNHLKTEWEENEDGELEIKMKKTVFHITDIDEKHIAFRKRSGGTGHVLVIKTLKDLFNGVRSMNQGLAVYYYPLIDKLKTYNLVEEQTEIENFVIILDEINRGNVSNIFGELITLLEEDKRKGNKEELEVVLPYSSEKFSVPNNLFIIGTMNTADRSVEALDSALRRRFSFVEIMPNPGLLKSKKIDGIDLTELLTKINERIEALVDRDHTIGHSYLMKVKDGDGLRNAFKNEIIPLLQEYFYGDYGKIGLVLGRGFVKMHAQENEIFADFEYDGSDGLAQNKFELIPIDSEFNMKEAIKTLLNNSGE